MPELRTRLVRLARWPRLTYTQAMAISDSIAETRLHVVDQPEMTVVVRIGRPVQDPVPALEWVCELEVQGINDSEVKRVHGVDSLQALTMAIDHARKLLDDSGLALSWESGEPGNVGIPRMVPGYLPRPFVIAAERCIDVMVEAFNGTVEEMRRAGR